MPGKSQIINSRCDCGNIKIEWQTSKRVLTPRACQCDFCREQKAAYVSDPRTRIEVFIKDPFKHKKILQGSKQAEFHLCSHCQELMLVTAKINGTHFGVINANFIVQQELIKELVNTDFYGQSGEDKITRWQKNWCAPVLFNYL